ncbi:hypothetical protein D3C81_1244190 [compost metagenome]
MTYGVGLVIFLVTGLVYLLSLGITQANIYAAGSQPPPYSWIGFILGLNPAGALISIFEPSFSDTAFLVQGSNLTASAPIELWLEFLIFYSILIVLFIWLAIRYIRPVKRGAKRKSINQGPREEKVKAKGAQGSQGSQGSDESQESHNS